METPEGFVTCPVCGYSRHEDFACPNWDKEHTAYYGNLGKHESNKHEIKSGAYEIVTVWATDDPDKPFHMFGLPLFFTTKEAAQEVNPRCSVEECQLIRLLDGFYYRMFPTPVELFEKREDLIRNRALAKLDDAEKRVLGLPVEHKD